MSSILKTNGLNRRR